MWTVDEQALEDITLGSSILGSGGGGDPYIGMLLARESMRRFGQVQIADISEVPDDAHIVFIAGTGAPGVLVEKLPRIDEFLEVLRTLEASVGHAFDFVCPAEAGGLNAVTPFVTAAAAGIPVVDSDGMGRAFPEWDLVTPTLYGASATPVVMADEHGNVMTLRSETNRWSEKYMRAAVTTSGAIAATAMYPMTGAQARERLIHGGLTLAQGLGESIRLARVEHRSPVDEILQQCGGVLLFRGKVAEVERRNEEGWTRGTAWIEGLAENTGSRMSVHFQNENLAALVDDEVVATTPDLIMALEMDSGQPIMAEEIRYGYRVAVVGLPSDPQWRTPAGLALAGPQRFGYDWTFRPVESNVTSAV